MYRLILFLMIASVSFAGSYQPNDIDKQIIQLSFNDKFDEAKDLSQRQINLNPDSPKYYYYKINAMVLEYFERITSIEIDKRNEERERINNEMISYVEEVIERFEDKELELEDKFYYGTILGYLARMQGLSGSWWGAFNTGSDARNIMEEILEADPKFYDTYLLLGMLEYYADRLSGVIGFVASVFGYSGDREKGLEYLNLALEKGTLAFGQTNLTLIEIYAQLEDNEYKALPYFEKFLERYPENKRIINGYVHELINTWNLDRADSIIVNDEKNLVNEYTRARYFDRIGNSEQAIKYASKVINNSSRNWRGMTNHAKFILAKENWIMGNDSIAYANKDSLNGYMQNRFNELVENKEDVMWMRSLTQAVIADDEKQITTMLVNKPEFNDSTDFENQFHALIGDFHFKNSRYQSAENSYLTIARSNRNDLKYYSYKQLIEIYLRIEAGKEKVNWLVEKIDEFDNDRLSFRVRDLEKKYDL
jgi:hypothetical protein